MVNDFYSKVDAQTYSAFTRVDFGDRLDGQNVTNGSTLVIEYSFDGVTKHGELAASGVLQTAAWDWHPRAGIWLRRQDGATGGGVASVHVRANRQTRIE